MISIRPSKQGILTAVLFSGFLFNYSWAQKPIVPKPTNNDKAEEIAKNSGNSPVSDAVPNQESTTPEATSNQGLFGAAGAQESTPSTVQPIRNYIGKKKSTLELGINLRDSASTVVLPTLRYRYFLNKQWAIRAHLDLRHQSATDYFYDSLNNSGTVKNSQTSWGIQAGSEYHFKGTNRLSPYVGAFLGIGVQRTRQLWSDYYNGQLVIDTVPSNEGYFYNFNYEGSTPSLQFNLNLVAGFDYYLSERLYTGLELGWSYVSTNTRRGVYTWSSPKRKGEGFLNDASKSVHSSFSAFPNIRVGWRF